MANPEGSSDGSRFRTGCGMPSWGCVCYEKDLTDVEGLTGRELDEWYEQKPAYSFGLCKHPNKSTCPVYISE